MIKLKPKGKGKKGEPGVFKNTVGIDQARKKDIDFEGMSDKAGNEAFEAYEKVKEIFGGEIPKIDHLWATIIDPTEPQFAGMNIDEKRNFYHNQPGLIEVKKLNKELGFFFELENYQCTVDEYVQRARKNSFSTFAILKDGEWFEKGEMGWWAMVSNEKSEADWDDVRNKIMDSIGQDELISIYDCHI